MSIYFSRWGLNTYDQTPYFRAQIPPGYPLSAVLMKCRAFRRLPPNLRELSVLSKRWAKRKDPDADLYIKEWYDDDGNELDPGDGRKLTDAEIDAQWQSVTVPDVTTTDIPISPGGFADPETWEEPPDDGPEADADGPTEEQIVEDVRSHGLAAAAAEYGVPAERMPHVADAQSLAREVLAARRRTGG